MSTGGDHPATGGKVGSGGAPGVGGATSASGGTVGTSSGGMPGAAGKGGGGGQVSTESGGRTGGGGAAGMNAGLGGAPKGGAGGGPSAAGGAGGAGGAAGCGPKTCTTGCCDGDRCVTTHTSDKCGANGAACTKCNSCFRCGNAGACEVDPMSTWKIVCVGATLSSTKTNFQSWDSTNGPGGPVGGGGPGSNGTDLLPDPFCQLSVGIGDNVVGTTAILDNTITPRWNEAITSTLSPMTAAQLTSQSTPWAISVQDDDGRERPELACRITPQLAASDFVSTDVTFNNVQSCLTLSIHLACQSP